MTADIHTLAGAYSLHALDPEEARLFERHLEACASCQEEVRGYARTATLLATAVEEPPPASLRGRLLAQVDVTPQARPVVTAPPSWRLRVAPVLVPVAAGLALALLVLTGGLVQQNRELASLRLVQQQREAVLHEVLAAGDAQRFAMAGDGEGTLLWSPSRQVALLVADGLASLPADRTYQLWLMRDGVPLPSELFRPDGQGRVVTVVRGTPEGLQAAAVTVEPAGGVQSPTGTMVLAPA